MFGGKTKPEIDSRLAALIAAADRRARALSTYRIADAEVTRLRAELLDLVAGSQHEVSVHLVETAPGVPVAER